MLASEVALKAVDILNQRGWVRGTTNGPSGQTCIMGAIEAALKPIEGESYYDIYDEVRTTLVTVVGKNPIGWNDRIAKSKREVISKLKKTAKLLQKEGK